MELQHLTLMIELIFFESEAEALAAAHALEKLGGRAKKLLAECIEHQVISTKSISETARALSEEGFIFIRGCCRFVTYP